MKAYETRTAALLGDGYKAFRNMTVAVFGIGGVGSAAAEALIRSGVGTLVAVDGERVEESNINRQLIAETETVGIYKTEALKKRGEKIGSDTLVVPKTVFFGTETAADFDFSEYDYVIDAVDNITAKLLIAEKCRDAGTPLISVMGTGNKLHPEMLKIGDIYGTVICPLCRVMRKELKKRGIDSLTCVWSDEEPRESNLYNVPRQSGRPTPASVMCVPAAAGMLAAGHILSACAEQV